METHIRRVDIYCRKPNPTENLTLPATFAKASLELQGNLMDDYGHDHSLGDGERDACEERQEYPYCSLNARCSGLSAELLWASDRPDDKPRGLVSSGG